MGRKLLQVCKYAVLCLLGGCGGGGGSGEVAPQGPTLPPFTSYQSDFSSPTEGQPLHVAPCLYPIDPNLAFGSIDACGTPELNYPVTNYLPGNGWRLIVNAEPAWAPGSAGPPGQSGPLDGRPFAYTATTTSATLALEEAPGAKIPYLGLHSPPLPAGTLSFTLKVEASPDPSIKYAYLWLFFQLPNGSKVMILRYLYGTHAPFAEQWNWPAVESIYYPGALLIYNPVYPLDLSTNRVSVSVIRLAALDYPPALTGVFLGFEIAIEKEPAKGFIRATVSDLSFVPQ